MAPLAERNFGRKELNFGRMKLLAPPRKWPRYAYVYLWKRFPGQQSGKKSKSRWRTTPKKLLVSNGDIGGQDLKFQRCLSLSSGTPDASLFVHSIGIKVQLYSFKHKEKYLWFHGELPPPTECNIVNYGQQSPGLLLLSPQTNICDTFFWNLGFNWRNHFNAHNVMMNRRHV